MIRELSNKYKTFVTFSSKELEIRHYNLDESMVNDEARLPDEGNLPSYQILSTCIKMFTIPFIYIYCLALKNLYLFRW